MHCTACEIDDITLHLHYKITSQFFVAYIRKKLAAVKGENSIDTYYINGSNKQRKEYF